MECKKGQIQHMRSVHRVGALLNRISELIQNDSIQEDFFHSRLENPVDRFLSPEEQSRIANLSSEDALTELQKMSFNMGRYNQNINLFYELRLASINSIPDGDILLIGMVVRARALIRQMGEGVQQHMRKHGIKF